MPLRVPTATSMTTSATTPASLAAADRSRAFSSRSTAWMKLLLFFRIAIARRILLFEGLLVVMQILSTPFSIMASASLILAQQIPIEPVWS